MLLLLYVCTVIKPFDSLAAIGSLGYRGGIRKAFFKQSRKTKFL